MARARTVCQDQIPSLQQCGSSGTPRYAVEDAMRRFRCRSGRGTFRVVVLSLPSTGGELKPQKSRNPHSEDFNLDPRPNKSGWVAAGLAIGDAGDLCGVWLDFAFCVLRIIIAWRPDWPMPRHPGRAGKARSKPPGPRYYRKQQRCHHISVKRARMYESGSKQKGGVTCGKSD